MQTNRKSKHRFFYIDFLCRFCDSQNLRIYAKIIIDSAKFAINRRISQNLLHKIYHI
ncbi:hypothetical protein ACWIUD_03595 [Helicobacter sp. 23-1044]